MLDNCPDYDVLSIAHRINLGLLCILNEFADYEGMVRRYLRRLGKETLKLMLTPNYPHSRAAQNV